MICSPSTAPIYVFSFSHLQCDQPEVMLAETGEAALSLPLLEGSKILVLKCQFVCSSLSCPAVSWQTGFWEGTVQPETVSKSGNALPCKLAWPAPPFQAMSCPPPPPPPVLVGQWLQLQGGGC